MGWGESFINLFNFSNHQKADNNDHQLTSVSRTGCGLGLKKLKLGSKRGPASGFGLVDAPPVLNVKFRFKI